MKVKNACCSSCMGFFKEAQIFFACELKEIKCDKIKEEAYDCQNMECKFMFIEEGFNECDKFIFCDTCLNDPQKVKNTIENYIELFGVEDCEFPKVRYEI